MEIHRQIDYYITFRPLSKSYESFDFKWFNQQILTFIIFPPERFLSEPAIQLRLPHWNLRHGSLHIV